MRNKVLKITDKFKNLKVKKFKLNIFYDLSRKINIKYRLILFYGFLILSILIVIGGFSLVQYRKAISDKSTKFSSQITSQIKKIFQMK